MRESGGDEREDEEEEREECSRKRDHYIAALSVYSKRGGVFFVQRRGVHIYKVFGIVLLGR